MAPVAAVEMESDASHVGHEHATHTQRDGVHAQVLVLAVARAVKAALDCAPSTASRKRPRPAAPSWLPEQTRKRMTMETRVALARDQPSKVQQFLLRRRELLLIQTQSPVHPPSDSVCAICLENLSGSSTGPELLEALPCGHVYHRRCIDQWSAYNRCCPVDRSTFE